MTRPTSGRWSKISFLGLSNAWAWRTDAPGPEAFPKELHPELVAVVVDKQPLMQRPMLVADTPWLRLGEPSSKGIQTPVRRIAAE